MVILIYMTNISTSQVNPTWFIAIAATFVSLYVNPSIYDPFNSPKLWVIMLLSSWLLGYLFLTFKNSKDLYTKDQKRLVLIVIGFLISMMVSAVFTEVPYTAYFGTGQRRTGFIFYFCMAIFMISAALFFTLDSIHKLFRAAMGLSTVLILYGFIQHTGSDFIKWENPYNSIILTLGNPNFSSALMAMLLVLSCTLIIASSKYFKVIYSGISALLLLLIIFTNSRQGLISGLIGISIMIVILTFTYNRRLGYIITSLLSISQLLILLGMLQIGPLVKYVYKVSVSTRGYYWRSGIEMLQAKPLTGIGLDSYGDYFKEYRETRMTPIYGFDLSSDNAHNVPIQIFSTSGLFTGFFYLLIIFFIAAIGIKAIKANRGKERVLIVGLFSSWVAFQSQSLISIDNVGLTVWGWLLGGAIVGVSAGKYIDKSSDKIIKKSKANINLLVLKQRILSGFLVLLAIILCSALYQGEKNVYRALSYYNFNSTVQSVESIAAIEAANATKFVDPNYRLRIAYLYIGIGEYGKAKSIISAILIENPRNLNGLLTISEIYEMQSDWENAAIFREKLAKLDPWNSRNLLKLAEAYTKIDNIDKAIIKYQLIVNFDTKSPEGKLAAETLKKLVKQ